MTALRSPSTEEVDAAVRRARTFSRSGACLIEEFVEGQLHSHTAFLGSDGIVADFIVEEHGAINPFAVDTSRVVFDFDPALLRAVRTAIEQIARDLKLTSGLIHTQFIIDGTRFWIVEITRRCPGDLYSVLIALSTGFNYAENYVRPFLGQAFQGRGGAARAIMRHTIALRQAQTFAALRFHRPVQIERFVPLALAGDRVAESPCGRSGILFARCADGAELDELMAATLAGALYTVEG